MKNLLLCIVVFAAGRLFAQLPEGVKLLTGPTPSHAFMFKDASGTIWEGLGAFKLNGQRASDGLRMFRNNQWTSVYAKGIFTDAMEKGDSIFFTAYDGLYSYRNDSMSRDPKITYATCITNYLNATWIGTIGFGLHEFKNGGFHPKLIRIDGVSYDSVYSLCPDGNILWVGTSRGLVRYENGSFSVEQVPVVGTGYKSLDYKQLSILSMQRDRTGKLWYANGNITDTIPCLYLREKGQFIDAMSYYREQCAPWGSIPPQIWRLGKTGYGNILVGTWWGVIELSDRILNYAINPNSIPNYNFYSYNMNAVNNVRRPYASAYEGSDGVLYACTDLGVVEINRSKYNMEKFRQSLGPATNNNNSIDINDINASISNDGTMFNASDLFQNFESKPVFSSKSTGCNNVMFTAGLWMGGRSIATGDMCVAAQTYRQRGSDFLPGPVDISTFEYDSAMGQKFNRVWKIDRETIDVFLKNFGKPGYVIPKSILEWPGNAPVNCNKRVAPYIDTDRNGIYEPAKGDYPEITGDQMLWWVFNDLGVHGETGGQPFRFQINAKCYAYKDIRLSPKDSDFVVNRTIFFQYSVMNLTYGAFDNFYMGIFNDVDLGNYNDDYVGCDTNENCGFGFNGDNYDEGKFGFGKNPPMIVCKFLNQKMDHFYTYRNDNDPVNGNPDEAKDYYAYLRSGTYYNDSFVPLKPYWGEINYPCSAKIKPGYFPSDRRFLMSFHHPETVPPGYSFTLDFAYVLLHDPAKDFLKDECNKPKATLHKIQDWYDNGTFPSKPYWPLGTEEISARPGLHLFPNPANSVLTVGIDEESGISEIMIYDMSGRVVYEVSNQNESLGEVKMDISGLSQGIYLVRVRSGQQVYNTKFVKQD